MPSPGRRAISIASSWKGSSGASRWRSRTYPRRIRARASSPISPPSPCSASWAPPCRSATRVASGNGRGRPRSAIAGDEPEVAALPVEVYGEPSPSARASSPSGKEDPMAQQTPRVKPIPDGYHSATPYLIVEGAARAIDFYKRAFNATELMRIPAPNQRIGHAEIKIGDSVIMLAGEHPALRGQRRRGFPASRLGRGQGDAAGGRPVLRRPLGQPHRSLRSPLAPLDPQGRREHGGASAPHGDHVESLSGLAALLGSPYFDVWARDLRDKPAACTSGYRRGGLIPPRLSGEEIPRGSLRDRRSDSRSPGSASPSSFPPPGGRADGSGSSSSRDRARRTRPSPSAWARRARCRAALRRPALRPPPSPGTRARGGAWDGSWASGSRR